MALDRGATGAFNYLVTPASIANDAATLARVPAPTTPPARTFAGITYNNTGDAALDTVVELRLRGTSQPNQFTVSPSHVATYFIEGRTPGAGTPDGDYLKLDTTQLGTERRQLLIESAGNGFWRFSDARQVGFRSIERFNHVAVVASGADANPLRPGVVIVRDAETRETKFSVVPYENFHGGVRVATGDFNGDGFPDLIVAPGPGRAPLVKIYDGSPDSDGRYPHALLTSFNAFLESYRGGVNLTVGDINGDGRNDLVVGMASGTVPKVRVFDGSSLLGEHSQTLFNPFVYNSRHGGVAVAVGDNNDGRADIVVGRGPGMAPQVKVYDGAAYAGVVPQNNGFAPPLVRTWQPFSPDDRGGVFVAVGDFNGGVRDVIVGAGSGSQPQVSVYSGSAVFSSGSLTALASFLAQERTYNGGVRVAAHPSDGGNPGFGIVEKDAIFMAFGRRRTIARVTHPGIGLEPHHMDWMTEARSSTGGPLWAESCGSFRPPARTRKRRLGGTKRGPRGR